MEAPENSRVEMDGIRLRSILQEICPRVAISMDAELVRDLGVDSVAMLSFILAVENAFALVIGGKEIEDNVLLSLSSLHAHIASRHSDAPQGSPK